MSVRDEVLLLLERRKGEYCSGEEIARQLFVTRNAVWKAVSSLRAQGYPIEAVTNRGYRLSEEGGIFSAQSVRRCLGADDGWFSVEVAETVTSTNTVLKERAAAGAPEGTVLIARQQTGGRGRLGRSFASPRGTGLYTSILLRPKMRAEQALFLTTAVAVAVAEAIEEHSGKPAGIKWVNDIWIGGRKVCGILTEASIDFESGGLEYAVVGWGINLVEPPGGFPGELRGIAGAVFDAPPSEEVQSRLIASTLRRFKRYYETFSERAFWQGYCDRSILIGKEITILGAEQQNALALGIDGECRLRVRLENGEERLLSSGEVSVRPQTGERGE